MKSINHLLFILITALLVQGCVASSSGGKKKSSVIKSSNTTTPTSPIFASDETTYWFTNVKVLGTITANVNSDSVVYLRGSKVHTFLNSIYSGTTSNYQRQYCLVGNFSADFRQLRVRAVPISLTSSNKAIERAFRIDLPSADENESTCGTGTIAGINAAIVTPEKLVSYSIKDLCFTTGCNGASIVTASSLKLFPAASTTEIGSDKLTLTSMGLKLDLLSNSTSPESCTNSSCSAKGFDCCSEGQCVKDASIKSSASSDLQYAQAMNDFAINPLSFINYPNIFNICSNIAHVPPPVTTPGETPLTAAQLRVQNYIADYKCINQVATTGSYSLCLPGGLVADFNTTKKKLAVSCGCPSTYTDNEVLAKCPDWGVKPIYKSSVETIANIVDFFCYTPAPTSPIGTITNLNVNVPSRSAPHRFYSTAGANVDDVTKVSTSTIQEGDDFYYQDDVNKMSPINNKYNMNSVLGRMNVALSQTHPAKMIAVELGQSYILTTTSGYFTPCSQCAKDSWFQNFFSHPASSNGLGLKATGHTTSRDAYSNNTTYGNYEDTHFGRACYLPPTMIPFSHMKNTNVQTQRQARLKTQAALYINGYQKDWFGFNKGAMIGSFDGVKWFAIGSGRRIAATSSKLYLAVNGAFQDLATRTDIVVNIIPDNGGSIVSEYDYDPQLTFTDIKQGTAASCQSFHQCSNDADCVTQLGWEYSCAEVAQMKTKWPAFDSSANELANQEQSGNIFEILNGTTTPGENTKRCVYRGAGAPCSRTLSALNGKVNQKALTCAPNFYCASLDDARYNDELVRSPNELDNFLYGMEANVLGRPLKYVTATRSLATDIKTNLRNNAGTGTLGIPDANQMGICRPGKSLSADPMVAHDSPDVNKRTDYISQVGSCDSTALGKGRVLSCGAFDSSSNYIKTQTTADEILRQMQNSCGGEARKLDGTSAYTSIEARTLNLITSLSTRTLVADACYRRAGSVCHTDLDCSPNKMHEEATNSLSLSYFGGTEAEQSYWKESLICGQGAAMPTIGTAAYSAYKLSENRCCREVGKDFTMYTSGPATIIPENLSGSNTLLVTSRLTQADPKADYRYSRYTASKTALETPAAIPKVNTNVAPVANQWKVINETGSQTCCGGGWIRKFSDGSNNWKIKNRLSLEVSNLSCLNYRSPLVSSDFNDFINIDQTAYQREYENLCKWPGHNGCMQILYNEIVDETVITAPVIYDPALDPLVLAETDTTIAKPSTNMARLDTSPVGDISGDYTKKHSRNAPYQPFPFYFPQYPFDVYTHTNNSKEAFNFFLDKDTDYGVSMYLPAYIPVTKVGGEYNLDSASRVYIKYFFENGTQSVVEITGSRTTSAACNSVVNYPAGSTGMPVDTISPGDGERWCITANTNTQNRPVMSVKAYTGAAVSRQWFYASIIIDFKPLEKVIGTTVTVPGSMAYYLNKLAKLELIGIPQIAYEPIYCNSNADTLVPGIFTSTLTNRLQFDANSFPSYDPYDSYVNSSVSGNTKDLGTVGNPDKNMTFQDKLAHPAIFSSKDFMCCTPLGKETASAAKCCSGNAVAGSGGKQICKLPSGTDLNVYFNKFVSNEGVGETLPLGGLITTATTEADIDFNQNTGEPKNRASTLQKILELGKIYCQGAVVRNGGAFANFESEPYSGYNSYVQADDLVHPVSIIDSLNDKTYDQYSFDSGYRWNHHYYCK